MRNMPQKIDAQQLVKEFTVKKIVPKYGEMIYKVVVSQRLRALLGERAM